MKRLYVIALLLPLLFLSQSACQSSNQPGANTSVQSANTAAPIPSNQNQPAPQRAANTNANNDPFPELVMLYSQLFTARMKGDKAKVENLLADDYRETTGDGKTLNKAQVLAAINDAKKSEPYSLDELKSNTSGDTGTVTARVTVMGQGSTETWRALATFKKEQGGWRATSSKITDYKKTEGAGQGPK